ncbi:MAG: YHS domain-containing protein [Pseudomonadota bacterium]
MNGNDVLNRFCPNSGKPVEVGSLTPYRGHTVGFCNPGCRDDFARNPDVESEAKTYFDVLIKERP